jgi:hypothetical protein
VPERCHGCGDVIPCGRNPAYCAEMAKWRPSETNDPDEWIHIRAMEVERQEREWRARNDERKARERARRVAKREAKSE